MLKLIVNATATPHKWLLIGLILLSILNFLLSHLKYPEINIYPTCGQSAQDQRSCLLRGSFKYMTSIRSTSERSVHKSFYRAARANFDAVSEWIDACAPFDRCWRPQVDNPCSSVTSSLHQTLYGSRGSLSTRGTAFSVTLLCRSTSVSSDGDKEVRTQFSR